MKTKSGFMQILMRILVVVVFASSSSGFASANPSGGPFGEKNEIPAVEMTPGSYQSVLVFANPASINVDPLETFSVDIKIGPVNDLMTFATEIIYDPSVVIITGITEGNFMKEDGSVPTTFLKTIDNITGRCVIAITRLTSPPSGITSSVNKTLLSIQVKANNPGTAALAMIHTGLIGHDGFTTYDTMVTNAIVKVFLDPNHSTVTFSPSSISAFPEENFAAEVQVSDIKNLFAVSFDIHYNPELVAINSITEGDFLNESGQINTIFLTDIDNDTGKAIVGITRLNTTTGVRTGYPKNLFKVNFSSKRSGSTYICLANVGLLAPDGVTTYPVLSEKLIVGIKSDEGLITGTITNKSTGLPIPGVIVKTLNYESDPSDAKGKYLLKVPYGYGYELTVMSGLFETVTIGDIHFPEYAPLKEINIQLVPVPIEHGIVPVIPDPNPVISTAPQEGVVHRYYMVINKLNGKPLPLVPVNVVGENFAKVVISDKKGIIDIAIQSNQIGNGLIGTQGIFSIISVNNAPIYAPIQFTARITPRVYSRYFDGENYLKLGGNLSGLDVGLKLVLGGITTLSVDESNSLMPKEIQIARQGRGTAEIGFSVKSPGLKGKLGPVQGGLGAEAGAGIAFTGIKEDEYIFPYNSANDYQKIAKYILIADGNYKLLDNTLIRLLTVCEMLFSDDATLLEANKSDAVGIEVVPNAYAEASAGISVGKNLKFGLFGDAGVEANAGFMYKFDHQKNQIESSLSLSGQRNLEIGAGIKVEAKGCLDEIGAKTNIYETEFRRGLSITTVLDIDDRILEYRLTFLSRNFFQKWEEEVEYRITGDEIIQKLQVLIEDLAQIGLALKNGLNIFVDGQTFQNLINKLFNLIYDSYDTSIAYTVSRTELTKNRNFDLELELSATALAGSFGAGGSFEEGKTMIVEEGRWAWGKHFINQEYSQPIPTVPIEYKTLMQNIIDETPLVVRAMMGDFRWLFSKTKSTNELYSISENGSFINLPSGAIPAGVDSLSVTSWSWYGGAPNLKAAGLSSSRQSIALKNKLTAEEIYGMKYGIGGFYQFEPYGTELLDTARITIKYDHSELDGIDEKSLGMYWEDKANKKWTYIGGVVDTVNNTVTAPITKLSLFTLAPAMPFGEFGLHALPDSLYADGLSITTIVSDSIFNNNHNPVSNGTLFNIGLAHGTITTQDKDPVMEGIQIPVENGKLTFQVRSHYLAGIEQVKANSIQGSAFGFTQIVYYDTIAPSAPIVRGASPNNKSVNLKWKGNPEADLAGYIVYYDTDTIAPFNGVHTVYGEPSPIIMGIDTLRSIPGLLNDSTYFFAVSAYDDSGNEGARSYFVHAVPGISEVQISKDLKAGWNWFSVNVNNADMSVGAVLSNLNLSEGDYIKNQTVSATYYDGFGWFGELAQINPCEMYKIKLGAVDTLIFEGQPVNPVTNTITINSGWNWIGYLPQSAQLVSSALSSINPVVDDYIKNQTNSSTYYDGFGWFGELSEMSPLDGYMLKTSHVGTLTYPAGEPLKAVGTPICVLNERQNIAGTPICIQNFEYSGQVTATVYLNGRNFESEDYCLFSVVGSQVRGMSRGMWFEPSHLWVHNHLTYSNFAEGDTVRFRLHDANSDTWYQFEELVVFKDDMLIGNALDPFILQNSSVLAPCALSLEPSLSVWPNPANNQATIRYAITTDQDVVIQVIDLTGRVIKEMELGNQTAGEHLKLWSTETLEQGVYHLRIKGTSALYKQVVIIR